MDPDTLALSTATDIAAAVRSRKVGATAVVRACLDRIERLEPRLNPFVTVTADEALQAAHRLDRRVAAGEDAARP